MSEPEVTRAAALPYAEVVVNTSLSRRASAPTYERAEDEDEDHLIRTFTYRVPEALQGVLAPGHLVWAPFGARHLMGVVVRLVDSSPVERTKDIDRLIDPEPMLLPEQIELAHWISEHYLAPLHQVIWAMIAPGVTEQAQTMIEAAPPGDATQAAEDALTPGQHSILALLREQGPMPLDELGQRTPLKSWRAMVRRLEQVGLAQRRVELGPSRVRPLYREFVRLSPDVALAELPGDEAPRQRDAVDYIRSWALFQGDREGWMMRLAVQQETGAPLSSMQALIERGVLESVQRQVWRDPLAGRACVPVAPPRLTSDQEAIWGRIQADLGAERGRVFLLQGVTGSGKTEIYLRAVQRALAQGRGAIVLVPEIALTPQTVRRFGARHPSAIAVMHSELAPDERYDQWRRIRAGELRLVVGSRSAIFSPVRDLGLIVLDEEHEGTYKQERTPRYHARQVALRLAELTGATVILGTATPSLESAYLAERGRIARLSLPQRVMGHRRTLEEQAALLERPEHAYRPAAPEAPDALYTDLPPVEVIDLRAELRAGNTGPFSQALEQALAETLAAGQQAILFVNRRGAASFILCRDCGYVALCPRCQVPLTYHADREELLCHHCSLREPRLEQCPECLSRRIRYTGLGTQRVEALVRELHPEARVVRWDYDATRQRGAHDRILEAFIQGEADVMVGTQMIAKGLDLPRVTLVGVVSADTLLHLPDLRAGERTFQLLTQVAGRAGRSILGGRVIIQTYTPEHPSIQAASHHDYDTFYAGEIAFRREHWYPPLSRLIRLVCLGANPRQVQHEAETLSAFLAERIARLGLPEVDLIGPAPCFYERLRGRYRWQILVRGRDPAGLLRDLPLAPEWRIDVDPEDLL
jgi:primosomal protein N' (replication factor Y)